MKRFLLYTVFTFCVVAGSFSQTTTVSGTVTDVNGEILIGASITIKGTTKGTITDVDGYYNFDLNQSEALLVYSYVGMKPQEISAKPGEEINVVLLEENIGLEELVVVGYGSQKKESVVSAIDQVSGEDIEGAGTPSVMSALSGLSPGMNVIVETGEPGADMGKIYVRGRSDFSNDQALILVDGVEQVVDINSFDPSEIETISVLKDAAATSVYGVKGANGVIIITTKRGKAAKPKISYNGESTLKRATFTPDMLSSHDAMKLRNVGYKNDQLWNSIVPDQELGLYRDQSMPYLYPDVDWWNEMIKPLSYSQKHNLAMRGGNDFVRYYTGLSYLKDGSIYDVEKESWMDFDPSFSYKRISMRNNMDFSLTETTELLSSFSGQVGYKNSPSAGNSNALFQSMYILPNSAFPINYPEEVLLQYPDEENDPYMDSPNSEYRRSYNKDYSDIRNPYNSLRSGQEIKKTYSLSGDLELVQKLDFLIKGLEFRGKYNYSSTYTFNQSNELSANAYNTKDIVYKLYLRDIDDPASYVWERSDPSDPNKQESSNAYIGSERLGGKSEVHYYRMQLNYARSFGDHNVTAMGLFSRRKEARGSAFPYYNEDWVSRVTYNYKRRYLIEFSGAYNGDESFANDYKFRFFPAIAFGWNLGHEKFVKNNLPWIYKLKLRYSYGQTGSASGAPRWGYLSEYGIQRSSSNTYGLPKYYEGWQFGVTNDSKITDAIGPLSLAVPDATWAVTTKNNFGIDFGFFDNKVSGNVEFFQDYREGIFIAPQTIPSYLGLTVTPPKIGVGEIKKHGYEVSLSFRNTIESGLNYEVAAGYGFNENRVVYKDDPALRPLYQKSENKPITTTAVFQDNGYFNSIDEIVNYADYVQHQGDPALGDVKPVDYNADGVVDDKDKVKLNLNEVPQNNYSFSLSSSYKGFSARVFFTGVFNYNMVENTTYAYPLYNGFAVGREDQLDYWTSVNTNSELPTIHANPNNYTTTLGKNSQRVINMNYFRVKAVELSYTFNPRISAIESLQIYTNGNNLYTITEFEYGDPEGKNVGSGDADYPNLQRYNIGLRVTF